MRRHVHDVEGCRNPCRVTGANEMGEFAGIEAQFRRLREGIFLAIEVPLEPLRADADIVLEEEAGMCRSTRALFGRAVW